MVRCGPIQRWCRREGECGWCGSNVRFDARNVDSELAVLDLELHHTGVEDFGDDMGAGPARR